MEPFPANSKTVQKVPRKRQLDRNQDVQNVPIANTNLAQRATNTYNVEENPKKRQNVKEVYVCPKELQGIA